ncbi:hypothetical protein D3C86_1600870 [compost metagenome]
MSGKKPSLLYFSAKPRFCAFSSSDCVLFFFLGKSALTKTQLSLASFLNSSDCHTLLSSLMQGAHQSEPENTRTIGLLSLEAIDFASAIEVFHFCEKAGKLTVSRNSSKIFFILEDYFFIDDMVVGSLDL